MFDWVDIGLHTLVATVLAWVAVFVSGFGFTGETRGGREFSMAGSLIANANTVLWPLRELLQHGGRWGGMQSQLEWMAPVLAAVVVTCFLAPRSPWLLPARQKTASHLP